MFIIYGTKRRYENNVIEDGITHNSAAYFLISEVQDKEKLKVTLMCSIYHAIGIVTLNRSICNHENLSISIKEDSGIIITVLYIDDRKIPLFKTETYFCGSVETHPYAKVRNVGIISMKYIGSVKIKECYFEDCMEDKSKGLRFFQKLYGKVQFINNCNMSKLSLCCEKAALMNLDSLINLLRR